MLFSCGESFVESVRNIVSNEIEAKGHYKKDDCNTEERKIVFAAHDRFCHFRGYRRSHGASRLEK
jgi:hypothetical protein